MESLTDEQLAELRQEVLDEIAASLDGPESWTEEQLQNMLAPPPLEEEHQATGAELYWRNLLNNESITQETIEAIGEAINSPRCEELLAGLSAEWLCE